MPFGIVAYVEWPRLLTDLGFPVSGSRPGVVVCPLCRKPRGTVYDDSGALRAWLHCGACGASGSMIDIVAGLKNCSDRTAATWLSDSGYTPKLVSLERGLVEEFGARAEWEHVAKVDEESAEWHDEGHFTELLVNILGEPPTAPEQAFLGKTLRAVAKKACCPKGPKVPKTWRRWLVYALEDLPGRPSRIAIRGEDGETHDSGGRSEDIRKWKTCSVFLTQALSVADEHLILCDQHDAVIRIQADSIRDTGRPAPIVGVLFGQRPSRLWGQVSAKKVLWVADVTPRAIREAAAAKATIYVGIDPPESLAVRQLSRTLARRAAPWQTVLVEHLRKLPVSHTMRFIEQLQFTPGAVAELATKLTPKQRQAIADRQNPVNGYQCGDRTYARSPTGIACGHREVSNCFIEIQTMTDTRPCLYSGTIHVSGRQFPFRRVSSELLERDTLGWLRHTCWKRGQSPPVIANELRPYLFDVCFAISQPAVQRQAVPVGWADGRLQTADYAIASGGKIETRACVGSSRLGRLSQPEPISGHLVADTDAVAGMSAALDTVAYIAAGILQPAGGYSVPALWLCGATARHFGLAVAAASGCTRAQPGKESRWPQLWTLDRGVDWLGRQDLPAILSETDWLRSLTTAALSGHIALERHDDFEASRLAATASGQILPAYLHDVARRDFEIPFAPGPGWHRVIVDFYRWWREDCGGAVYESRMRSGSDLFVHATRRILGECMWRSRGSCRLIRSGSLLGFQESWLSPAGQRALSHPLWRDGLAACGVQLIQEGTAWFLPASVLPSDYPYWARRTGA